MMPTLPLPPNPGPTPTQVIRAFRLDDELRDMMLPLLSVPAEKFSVTGVNVKAQVAAGQSIAMVGIGMGVWYYGHTNAYQEP